MVSGDRIGLNSLKNQAFLTRFRGIFVRFRPSPPTGK